jgi:hypothetical protein
VIWLRQSVLATGTVVGLFLAQRDHRVDTGGTSRRTGSGERAND